MLLALGLTGFVYFYEIQGSQQRETVKEQQQKVFAFQANQVQSFTVKTSDQTLTIERKSDNKSSEKNWEIKSPTPGPANQATVDFLLDRLTTGKSERTVTVAAGQKAEFGLDQPQATIEVKLANQQSHKLILGKPDFSGRFLYAQVDPPATTSENLSLLLVPLDFQNATNRPLSEWQQQVESQILDPRDR